MARRTVLEVSNDLDRVEGRLNLVEKSTISANANNQLLTHMVKENTKDIGSINNSFRWFMRTVIFLLLSGVVTVIFQTI